jgi:hypothetical protein
MTAPIGTAARAADPSNNPTWTCRPRGRSERTDAANTSPDPIASTDRWAPPSVIVTRSAPGATAAAAPSPSAAARAASDPSTPTTRAPSATPTSTADKPNPAAPVDDQPLPARHPSDRHERPVCRRQPAPEGRRLHEPHRLRQRDNVGIGRRHGDELGE